MKQKNILQVGLALVAGYIVYQGMKPSTAAAKIGTGSVPLRGKQSAQTVGTYNAADDIP